MKRPAKKAIGKNMSKHKGVIKTKDNIHVGDTVKIIGTKYYGMTGVLVSANTGGGCEIQLTYPLEDGTSSVYVWDYNIVPWLEPLPDHPVQEKISSPIKDSGERTEFRSGAVRDMHEGKGDMLSVPWAAMLRVSTHYENGAKKYGRYNYLKGIPVSSFVDSAIRHLAKYVAGYDDEDHLSAAAFNVLGAIQMEEEMPEMCDLPWRKGKREFHYGEKRDSKKVSTDVPGEGTQEAGSVRDNDRGQD